MNYKELKPDYEKINEMRKKLDSQENLSLLASAALDNLEVLLESNDLNGSVYLVSGDSYKRIKTDNKEDLQAIITGKQPADGTLLEFDISDDNEEKGILYLRNLTIVNDKLKEEIKYNLASNFKRVKKTNYDNLTGLLRQGTNLEEGIASLLGGIKKGEYVSIIFFDIDNFGTINKDYNHAQGDKTLKKVSEIAHEVIDPENIWTENVWRNGGEEIVALLPGKSKDEAVKIAKELMYKIRTEANITDEIKERQITISLGLLTYTPEKEEKIDEDKSIDGAFYIKKVADLLEGIAKKTGKDQGKCLELNSLELAKMLSEPGTVINPDRLTTIK